MKQSILLDTCTNYSIEDYKEYCEEMGIEFDENDEQAFYDWEYEMREQDIEDFWANLEYSEHKDDKVIITGLLGLWNGKHEIYPELTNLYAAIEKCVDKCDDAKIYVDEDGYLRVNGYHHDGANCFGILFLTEYGEENYDEDSWNELSDDEKEKMFCKGNFDYLF